MPDLVNINQEEDVVVLAINVNESKKVVQNYMDEHQYDFEVILDEQGEFARLFMVQSFPTSFFIDQEGILLGSVPGMLTSEVLEDLINKIRNDEL